MKFAVKQIRGKKLYELYTPAGANKDGFTDRDSFEEVVGNVDFHSFQVWRSSAKAKATCTYAMSLEQIVEICKSRDRKVSGLKAQLTKLTNENAQLRLLQEELKRLAQTNHQLRSALFDATERADKAMEEATLLQHNVAILSKRLPEEQMSGKDHSSTGKSAAQLVVESIATEFKGAIPIPMNGMPYNSKFAGSQTRKVR